MIELKNLQKVAESGSSIDLAEIAVASGEIASIVGPVGSGKKTLFDLLIGRTRPTAGRLRLAGIDPYLEREHFSQKVGVLFGEDNLYRRQSVESNLRFYGRLRRLPQSRIAEVLSEIGLADQTRVKVESLPSSLSRRLAFGRAILHDPVVLLLMEPFAGCDAASVALLSAVIRRRVEQGAAVLILGEERTHLETLSDVIFQLDQGRLVDSFRPGEESRPNLPFMIPVRLEGKVMLVDPADILYVVAQDNRTSLQMATDLIPTQFTMKQVEERLSRRGFFRAHRGYLVNLQHVKEVIAYTRNSYSLRLKDAAGTKIPLSKAAASELRDLLDY